MLYKILAYLPILITIIFYQIQKHNPKFTTRMLVLTVFASSFCNDFFNALFWGYRLSDPLLILGYIIGFSGFGLLVCIVFSFFLSKKSKEGWKEIFLEQISQKYGNNKILKVESKDYKLIGLPLYNHRMKSDFELKFNNLLL